MKQEQVIELGRKAGISVVRTQSGDDWLLDLLVRFAALVEQATLEMVIDKFSEIEWDERGQMWMPGTPGEVVRNLAKESQ